MRPIKRLKRRIRKWQQARRLEREGWTHYKAPPRHLSETERDRERWEAIRARRRQVIIEAGYGDLLEDGR